MPCAMNWKIEKCRVKHFEANKVYKKEKGIIWLNVLPCVPLQISFPINVNYVIFSHKCLKQTTTKKYRSNKNKMVRKNWWNTFLFCFWHQWKKNVHSSFISDEIQSIFFSSWSNAFNWETVPKPCNHRLLYVQ